MVRNKLACAVYVVNALLWAFSADSRMTVVHRSRSSQPWAWWRGRVAKTRIMVRRVPARVRVGVETAESVGQPNTHQQQPSCAKHATRSKCSTENEG